MEETIPPSRRRGFLRGTFVFLGSALGLKAASSRPSPRTIEDSGHRLRFYARSRSLVGAPSANTESTIDPRSRRGTLLAQPDGEPVGEYYSTRLAQPGTFGVQLADSPGVDLQTFKLPHGTLFGAGANERDAEGGTVHAVLGGTGRYAGARGTFTLSPLVHEASGQACVEITINLVS